MDNKELGAAAEILAIPEIARWRAIAKDYDAAKDLGPSIESTPNNAFYNSAEGQEWIARRSARAKDLGPSV